MEVILPIAGFFVALSGYFFELVLGNLDDDTIYLSPIKFIESHGYPAESHLVETEDGYFIQLHRIPHGKNSTSTTKSILFFHGVLTSSNAFLQLGADSLPFLTADRGYDVWLANARGTHYAKLHRTLSSKSSEFWNFSFHEIGLYDLPAQIDYICNYTKRDNIMLLGISFGTTVSLVMASTRPEYQKKLRAVVLIAAPSVFIKEKALFLGLLPLYPLVYSKSFTNSEVLGESLVSRQLHGFFGIAGESSSWISKNRNSMSKKSDPRGLTKVARYVRSYYTSSSHKVLAHYMQLAISGKFRQYDYGPSENLKKYNSREPPDYNLESITVPISLTFAVNDRLAGTPDEDYLKKRLKSIKSVLQINDTFFGHMSFVIGKKAKELAYDKTLDLMENL